MKKKNLLFALCFLMLLGNNACSQGDDAPYNDSTMGVIDTSIINKYRYIRYGLNEFAFPRESITFARFHDRFDSLMNFKDRNMVIYHIGGSHIQADIYTNRFRSNVQSLGPGLRSSRGWVFPYTMIGTNNPGSYKVEHTGEWTGIFNRQHKDTSSLGLLGVAAVTHDSISSFKIYYRKQENRYWHNRIRVYHNTDVKSYTLYLRNTAMVASTRMDTENGYTEFVLKHPTDTLDLHIIRNISDTNEFRLYGVELLNDEPGLIYNSIGVNGASFPSYLRCQLFEEQLKVSKPDMFIISIGTNDANTDDFRPEVFEKNYTDLIEKVRAANPNVALLLTVTNDCYYYKKYPNKNTEQVKQVIFRLAEKYECGVWDFYSIMGGYGSSQKWYKDGLMHKDRIHFTFEGYNIKGDLFYEAFLKFLDEFEFNKLVKISNRE